MSTDPKSDPFDYVDVSDFQLPDANQPAAPLEHVRVRNDGPDELAIFPTDATEDELATVWITAYGDESFIDLDDAR